MPSSRYIFGTLPYYSVLIVLGMVLAIVLASREEKRLQLPRDTVVDLALALIPISVICARIYYVIFAWDAFRDHLLSVFAIWEGGIAIYGGLIGGLLTVLVFSRIRRLSPLLLLDILVPGVALAQSIGRWGNFFNMEAYGIPVMKPELQFFPFAVQIPEAGGPVWHLATFFYESCWDLLLFLLLWCLRKKSRLPGTLFLLYSFVYAAGRLVIEGLRTDSLMAGSLRISQVLGFALCILILFLVLLRYGFTRPRILFWLFLLLQPLLFFLLPLPSAENALLPWFTLPLALLFPFVQISKRHSRVLKAASVCLCFAAWAVYAFCPQWNGLLFSLFFSITSLCLGFLIFCPAFQRNTEVSHADHTHA